METITNSDTALWRSVIDVLLERYLCWREECLAAHRAYRWWADSDRAERGLAYAGYLAALDREEHARRVYADQIEWVRRVCT